MWASASVNSRGAAAARRRQAQQRRAGGTARQGGSASPARSSRPLATLVATHGWGSHLPSHWPGAGQTHSRVPPLPPVLLS